MTYFDFFIFFPQPESYGGWIFNNKFSLLQTGNGFFDFIVVFAGYAKEVFNYAVVDGLLLHY